MTPLSDKPQTPPRPRGSRLAKASLALALGTSLLIWLLISVDPYEYNWAVFAIAETMVFASIVVSPILAIASIVLICRHRGRLTDFGFAIPSLIIAGFIANFMMIKPPKESPYVWFSGRAGAVVYGFCAVTRIPHPFFFPYRSRVYQIVAVAIQSLCTASRNYHQEYGHWPQPRSSGDLVLIFNGLINPRTGKSVSGTRPDLLQQNPRRIQFMKFKPRDVTYPDKPQDELAFYDPWGTPYAFAFDNGVGGVYYLGPGMTNAVIWRDDKADDHHIPVPFEDETGAKFIRGGFAFFSNGPDTKTGTGLSEPDSRDTARAYYDDVRSWR